jgi:LCP family protein required for cell wall assembly
MRYLDVKVNSTGKPKLSPQNNNSQGKKSVKGILISVAAISIFAAVILIFKDTIKAAFDPISIVASVNAAELKKTDGRTNILLLGSDKRSTGNVVTSILTDTILVASIGRVDNDVVLISVPRDLWVASSGKYHSKINTVYSLAEYNKKGSGPVELQKTIEEVLGIPIHYYALITFDLFENAVDILDGVEVAVENPFTDNLYPIEGKENAPENERYETVSFTQGVQTMNGKTALKFARSRHGDSGEGTDFARAKRQQKIIAAIKQKVFSLQTLLDINKIKSLYDSYSTNIVSNIDFPTIQSFYLLSKQVNLDKVVSVVLDDRSDADAGGLLYAPEDTTLYEGQYVLLPQTGDYTQIHAYVQRYLFGNK